MYSLDRLNEPVAYNWHYTVVVFANTGTGIASYGRYLLVQYGTGTITAVLPVVVPAVRCLDSSISTVLLVPT